MPASKQEKVTVVKIVWKNHCRLARNFLVLNHGLEVSSSDDAEDEILSSLTSLIWGKILLCFWSQVSW